MGFVLALSPFFFFVLFDLHVAKYVLSKDNKTENCADLKHIRPFQCTGANSLTSRLLAKEQYVERIIA